MNAIAEKKKPAEPRRAPDIDPALVMLDSEGFAFRSFFIRLPAEAISADLAEPGIWRRVQASRMALRKFDRMLLVAYQEDWVAEAIVAGADKYKAVLGKPRITAFPERYDRLFEDELYRVRWVGHGYLVERKSDGQRMTQPVPSVAIAERDLARLYPAAARK